MNILKVQQGRSEICRAILEALPDWFGIPEALEDYVRAATDQVMFACFDGGQAVGMLTLKQHSDCNLEIAVMGVLASHHRRGIGQKSIHAARDHAADRSIAMLSVKTVSDCSSDPYYAQTRAFYLAMGFELFEVFPDLWDAHNPCALYVLPVET